VSPQSGARFVMEYEMIGDMNGLIAVPNYFFKVRMVALMRDAPDRKGRPPTACTPVCGSARTVRWFWRSMKAPAGS
jgi:hypothetical protein